LVRIEGLYELADPDWRLAVWTVHVLAPLGAGWAWWAHRRRGRRPPDQIALRRALAAALGIALLSGGWQAASDLPRRLAARDEAPLTHFPSLARAAPGRAPTAASLLADDYCKQCHEETHAAWSRSAHRFSSFNNPAYRFSVLETRQVALARDGRLDAARWCAGCHDPVPLFTGRFDDPAFDDRSDPTATAGITCTSCHAIVAVNSVRGNADFTLAEPEHYPFAFSESAILRWASRQLVRSRPELHRATFLKPLHRSSEFCSTCHKVHLPVELNHDRWLRGQNHYDSFRLSGVSGHSAQSFYYPPAAQPRCASCHMPLAPSTEFGARDFDGSGRRALHDHEFAAANTAIAHWSGQGDEPLAKRREFLAGTVRVDLFALRPEGQPESLPPLPLRPELPRLRGGETYLLEVVVRNLRVGHELTQGTADSNELWVEVTASLDGAPLAASGGLDTEGRLDPWAHQIRVYLVDREGRRIDRRNPQDIYATVYNHQIPPGSADLVRYRLPLPPGARGTLELAARVRYRKFDLDYLRHVFGPEYRNDLPIAELGADRVRLAVGEGAEAAPAQVEPAAAWERWNDRGIGLLRQAGPAARGVLEAALASFAEVERLGRSDGAVNRARVLLAQGRPAEAERALARAADLAPPPPPWLVEWLAAQVRLRSGRVDEALAGLERILASDWPGARERGFDFAADERVWTLAAEAWLQRAQAPGAGGSEEPFARALEAYRRVLELDPESAAGHYGAARALAVLGRTAEAEEHRRLFERYRPDEPSRERAVVAARRRDPIADRLAEPVKVYELAPIPPGAPPAAALPAAQPSAGSRQGS
ncbi:MAG TPA: multiheme c-type cytochrome, partial [Thermoanaerobaculia bacterium]|nr:multiheme c-type cytochrome [Thermoanaerobaculia bacterium]